MKKVSIIIPCYNAEAYIEQCMKSLVDQSIGIEGLELIAVNDASTDHTSEMLAIWEQRYPQAVVLVNCEQNGRRGTACNIGVSYATADYISFVDADDWVEKKCYEKLYQKAMKYNCDAVATGYKIELSRNSSPVGDNENKDKDQFYIIENDVDRGAFVGIEFGVGTAGNLYRKSMLLENDIYFPEGYLFEDDFWYVLSMHCINRAYIVSEDFYHYYQHENSIIHKRNSPTHLDRAILEELKLQELIKRGIFQRFPTLYEHEFIRRYYMEMMYILFILFDEVNYKAIQLLHDKAYYIFPNYRKNPFIQLILNGKGGNYMKSVYDCLDAKLTIGRINELKKLCFDDNGSWQKIRI